MVKKYFNNENKERLYSVWKNMKDRCYRHKNSYFKNYGGRGIKVCDEWKNNYFAFREWAYSNGYIKHTLANNVNELTIDRINNDGDYEPSNCRWITNKEQASNKRNSIKNKTRVCAVCGKLFEAKCSSVKTCSRECGSILRSKTVNEKNKDKNWKECPICHKMFKCDSGHFKKRVYCSKKCHDISQSPYWEYNGQKHRIIEWAEIVGVNSHSLIHRHKELKWTIEKTLTTPLRSKNE